MRNFRSGHNIHEWKSNRNSMELSWVKCVLEPKSMFSGKEHTFLCKEYTIRENGNDASHVARLETKPTLVYGRITQNLKLCANICVT